MVSRDIVLDFGEWRDWLNRWRCKCGLCHRDMTRRLPGNDPAYCSPHCALAAQPQYRTQKMTGGVTP
jgi:hypothetical protein